MSSPTFELKDKLVRAGAGAGKTTSLIQQVYDVFEFHKREKARTPQVVITTFTRKATEELRERLANFAIFEESEEFLEFVSSPGRLHISTIHGVLGLFLRRYGHIAGLDPAFRLVSQKDQASQARLVAKKVLDQEDMASVFLSAYSFSQLTNMLCTLYESKAEEPNLKPYDQEGLLEVAKAEWNRILMRAIEIQECLSGTSCPESYVKFAESLKNSIAESPFYPHNFDQIREGLLTNLKLPRRNPKDPQALAKEVHESIKERIQNLKDDLEKPYWNLQTFPEYDSIGKEFEKVHNHFFSEWYNFKSQKSAYSFNDLELMSLKVIREAPGLAKAFCQDWDYWLIDEYQDTSPLQVELLNALIGHSPRFLVGDPQQSIYLFRGARFEVFADKQNEFETRQDCTVEIKDKNYRSDPGLLLCFNKVFSGLDSQFTDMVPKEPVGEEKNEVLHLLHSSTKNEEDQLSSILFRVNELVSNGVKFEEIAVLARTGSQLKKVAKFLRNKGVPVSLHQAGSLAQRQEVRDALSLLKFLANPHDNNVFLSLMRSPWFYLSDHIIQQNLVYQTKSFFNQLREELSEHWSLRVLEKALEATKQRGVVQAWLDTLIEVGVFDLTEYLDSSGRRESNLWKVVQEVLGQQRRPGFNPLNIVGPNANMAGEEGEGDGDAQTTKEPNHIQLMTVHKSKGLEFDHVILPFCEKSGVTSGKTDALVVDKEKKRYGFRWALETLDGQSEHSIGAQVCLRQHKERELKESQRLLYVAMTRARSSVALTWQGRPQKNSWISMLEHLPLSKGCHDQNNFLIRSRCDEWEQVESLKGQVLGEDVLVPEKLEMTRSAGSKSASVTELINKDGGLILGTRSQTGLDQWQRVSDGVMIHKALEILSYNWEIDFEDLAHRWFPGREFEICQAVEFVKDIKIPPIKELITKGEVEWGFQLEQEGEIIEGQIDLWGWGEAKKELWVVDYKSGNPEFKDKAFLQLEYYSKALRQLTGANQIHQAVIYPMIFECHTQVSSSGKD